ncbi:DUF5691 domain-containing protein [Scleromatobacter humisilvae]|uniref:DUF5691 domain-containing protein n=1 Tax=Scleromatobacter humisilvae TaxID=2897159 RepID=A0A9X1YGT7_9BURK|nr:DUF5691 domain-containing protein [Scleromatobacter humisilvae]MCK9686229.1 DUF5691 domain-containing protein [Scleromatobacter humisilvae]
MQDASAWSALLPVAMVGTDRHSAPLPRWPGEIGATIAALADVARPGTEASGIDQAAADVLRVAGVLAVCGLAGARPQACAREPVGPAAHDSQPVADDPAIAHWFGWALREGPDRLKQDFFLRFAKAGLRLPHALLPLALELARQSLALRATIQPLLGERGVWLARQREDWAFAAGVATRDDDDPRQWVEGTLEQRKAFLASERARDPRAARERLVAALPELPAKERAELARGLSVGLGMADEPLLDQLRADRSQDVRAEALELLLRLPEAAHPRRAGERIAALMSRGSLLTGRRWIIEPPTEAADDWKADQVEPAVGIANMGERAWWLYQLARQVPLAWWTGHTGLEPKQLAAWADGSDWAQALWLAWRDVLRRAPDRAWAEALLDDWTKNAGPRAVLGDRELVLRVVSPEGRERWFEAQLKSADAPLVPTIFTVVASCRPGETLSPRLSSLIIRRVKQSLALRPTADIPAAQDPIVHAQDAVGRTLPDLCSVLPLALLADFDDWPAQPAESAAVSRARHEGRQIIQARRALDAHLP